MAVRKVPFPFFGFGIVGFRVTKQMDTSKEDQALLKDGFWVKVFTLYFTHFSYCIV